MHNLQTLDNSGIAKHFATKSFDELYQKLVEIHLTGGHTEDDSLLTSVTVDMRYGFPWLQLRKLSIKRLNNMCIPEDQLKYMVYTTNTVDGYDMVASPYMSNLWTKFPYLVAYYAAIFQIHCKLSRRIPRYLQLNGFISFIYKEDLANASRLKFRVPTIRKAELVLPGFMYFDEGVSAEWDIVGLTNFYGELN